MSPTPFEHFGIIISVHAGLVRQRISKDAQCVETIAVCLYGLVTHSYTMIQRYFGYYFKLYNTLAEQCLIIITT